MRTVLAFLALVAIPSLVYAVPAPSVCPAPEPVTNLTQTLMSNFSKSTGINPAHWVAVQGNPFGDPAIEAQSYDPARVSIVPGTGVRLSTGPAPAGSAKPYTSGAIMTKGLFAQKYGRFEARIKVPRQNGMWPAFWLLPADGTWPPEIDVMEFIAYPNGQRPTSPTSAPWVGMNPSVAVHWKNAAGAHKQAAPGLSYNIDRTDVWPPFTDSFHTYAVDWRPELLNFMLDGKVIFCSKEPAAVPTKAMHLILNDAVTNGTQAEPGWAGYVPANSQWPQRMDVSHVGVWQFKDLLPARR